MPINNHSAGDEDKKLLVNAKLYTHFCFVYLILSLVTDIIIIGCFSTTTKITGEDPTLTSGYAVHYVSGLQGNETASKYLLTSACLKHFAAYSEETNRESFAAVVTSQDMEDTYLPAFHAGVTAGKASGLMCSYNAETYGSGIYG